MTAQLDRLLFTQGGLCFFCRKLLPKADASVEHLVASANGGTNDEGNCVACCKTLNHLLGAKSIREKMQIVLNQRGNFQCPAVLAQASCPPPIASASPAIAVTPKPTPLHASANTTQTAFDLVVSDLRKRGASRPRKVATLSSTIKALLKNQQRAHSDGDVEAVIKELQRRGQLVVEETKVAYKLG
ncbi:HNH endonuclease [Zoogloea sp.]|uniref:HNH endonuclease n=1 Tax=Zoogloea sp. TaxID=49181 RepID=UPI0035AFBFA5